MHRKYSPPTEGWEKAAEKRGIIVGHDLRERGDLEVTEKQGFRLVAEPVGTYHKCLVYMYMRQKIYPVHLLAQHAMLVIRK